MRLCIIFESNFVKGAWKGERVAELIEALYEKNFGIIFFGLRSLRDMPAGRLVSHFFLLFALPGQISRVAGWLGLPRREVRTALSQMMFSVATFFLSPRPVLTQTTLGSLIERLKGRGHSVLAECDMTWPRQWQRILLEEAERIGAQNDIKRELPTEFRKDQEDRAFHAADRIVVFSPWAFEMLPDDIQAKSVVVPSVSVAPENEPLTLPSDDFPIEFIFVGQIGFRKGFHILVETVENLAGRISACHVFGLMRKNFSCYMQRTGMIFPNSMNLHGFGDWRMFVKNNPARYVAVLPSFVEGSPRFIYEAAAMGLPAIVTPAARPAFFANDREALVLPKPAGTDLQRAMERFITEPALWERLSAAAYRAYSLAYNETSYGTQIAELMHGDFFRGQK